jgi:demethylmenaquinone methyltransferase/2-methoxy-6-polyprenyl-1,4-benzoquinol methylase
MVSKHTTAYSYLPSSVLDFPDPERLAEGFRRAGFRDVGYEALSLGIAMIHWGVRR